MSTVLDVTQRLLLCEQTLGREEERGIPNVFLLFLPRVGGDADRISSRLL